LPLSEKTRVEVYVPDLPFSLGENAVTLARYADELRDAAFQALDEEAILVVAYEVHHAE
jgi:hypothetical protein